MYQYHEKRESEFHSLFNQYPVWKNLVNNCLENSNSWLSFVMEMDTLYLKSQKPQLITDIFPSDVDLLLMMNCVEDFPHCPYQRVSVDEKFNHLVKNLYLMKNATLTWLEYNIHPVLSQVDSIDDNGNPHLGTVFYNYLKICQSLIGVIYHRVGSDFHLFDTKNWDMPYKVSVETSLIGLETGILDFLFAAQSLNCDADVSTSYEILSLSVSEFIAKYTQKNSSLI